jgi:D-xylulose kinase
LTTDQIFIGIDCGTQGTKVIALSRRQRAIIAEAYAPHDIIEAAGGRREQLPQWWTCACEKALTEVLADGAVTRAQVTGMAVSGQQHGLVPLDAEDRVIRPAKLWCDTETAPQAEWLTERLGGTAGAIAATGNAIAAGFTASKLVWLREKEPQNYERLATVLLPHDYLNFWLTGERRAEYGDASGTAFFDVTKRLWSSQVVTAIDPTGRLATCLPALMGPSEPCGCLRPELAARWGLPKAVLVAAGGGDNMMAAIGTGNVSADTVTVSLGTSGTIYAYSDTPMVDAGGEVAAFCASSGGWLPLVCTMNVTVSTEAVRKLLGLSLAEMNALAAEAPIGAGGVLLLPFFNGERTPPLPQARATLAGLSPLNFDKPHLCRAAMEGATLGLRYGLDALKRLGIHPREVRLVGGGARSALWRQICADLFAATVVSPQAAEAGALGAAIQALWCCCVQLEGGAEGSASIAELCDAYVTLDPASRTQPCAENIQRYDAHYRRYLALERSLRPVHTEIAPAEVSVQK